MNVAEARHFLGVGENAGSPGVRQAYLRGVRAAHLDTDPGGFIQLRAAYQTLIRGTVAPAGEVAAARDVLARTPDSVEARWALLSLLNYATDPEAFAVLREGAGRQPGEFGDELMFQFPEKAPQALVEAARREAGSARLLVVADVHAAQGRSADALSLIGDALGQSETSPWAAMLTLALRPVFSLHARNQTDAAGAALALVRSRAASAEEQSGRDQQTTTMLAVAGELGRLGAALPLELRQVAARAAKQGDFENARYEARFATRVLSPRAVRQWRNRLPKEAPALARMFALDLSEDQLRPRGTPNFRIAAGTGVSILLCVLFLAWRIHLVKLHSSDADDLSKDMAGEAARMVEAFAKANCADERCRRRSRELLPIETPAASAAGAKP